MGVGGPAVEARARDVVPGDALPGAEIEFLQARVESRGRLRQGVRDSAASACGAAPEGRSGEGCEGGDHFGDRGMAGGCEIEVEAAIADAGRDRGRRVTDQGNRIRW